MRRSIGLMLGIAIAGVLACSDNPDIVNPCDTAGCSQFQIDGAIAFYENCSGCHGLDRPFAASIPTRHEAWLLVQRMRNNGLTLAEADHAAIVDYLCEQHVECRQPYP